MKSNEEINRDLGISESSLCNEDEDEEHDETCDSKPMYNGIQGENEFCFVFIIAISTVVCRISYIVLLV